MEKSKLENFEDFYKYLRTTSRRFEMASEGSAPDDYQMNIAKDTWNHQQAKLDKANREIVTMLGDLSMVKELESENKQLKETLKLAVEVISSIAAEDYTIQSIISHREDILQEMLLNDTTLCRNFLESKQYKKVEGSL